MLGQIESIVEFVDWNRTKVLGALSAFDLVQAPVRYQKDENKAGTCRESSSANYLVEARRSSVGVSETGLWRGILLIPFKRVYVARMFGS